ncbi:MAG: HTH-type transcriptional repressor FabR [Gammaproteobacteria bacterium]|nr:HTH-type transcriptional repressor FabR [Gammaproteobacteria bacterium]
MSTRTDKKQQTRQNLIDAALGLLNQQRSFGSLSLREVAREAGLAPNAFYRHFDDMEDLGLALVDVAGQSLRTVMREARQKLVTSQSVLDVSVNALFDHIAREPQLFHMLLREQGTGSESWRRAIRTEIRYFTNELAEDLERLGQAKERPIADAYTTADAIVAITFGGAGNALSMSADSRSELAARLVLQLRMIMLGSERMAEARD